LGRFFFFARLSVCLEGPPASVPPAAVSVTARLEQMRGQRAAEVHGKQWASDGRCRRCTRPKLNDVLTGPPKGDPTLSTAAPCSTWPEGGGTARGPPHEPAVAPASGAPQEKKQAPSCTPRCRARSAVDAATLASHGCRAAIRSAVAGGGGATTLAVRRNPTGAARRRGETRGLERHLGVGMDDEQRGAASRGGSCHPAAPIGGRVRMERRAAAIRIPPTASPAGASTATSCDADRPAVAPSVRVMLATCWPSLDEGGGRRSGGPPRICRGTHRRGCRRKRKRPDERPRHATVQARGVDRAPSLRRSYDPCQAWRSAVSLLFIRCCVLSAQIFRHRNPRRPAWAACKSDSHPVGLAEKRTVFPGSDGCDQWDANELSKLYTPPPHRCLGGGAGAGCSRSPAIPADSVVRTAHQG